LHFRRLSRLFGYPLSQQQQQQQQQQNAARGNQSFPPPGFNHLPASPNPGASATDIAPAFFNNANMNPAAAKQFAALNAAGLRRAQTTRPSPLPGGPTSSSFLGGGISQQQSPSPAPGHDPLSALSPQGRLSLQAQSLAHQQAVPNQPANFNPSSSDPFMSSAGQLPIRQSQQQLNPQHKAKQRQFLITLANFHTARKDPLPSALTGVAYPPGFDPTQSKWKTLESSSTEPGSVMLAGKPVDLFKLWVAVNSGGGWAKVSTTLFA
jgi:SWI/SNF chromatin-remodeling complex subunit SWI1